MLCATEVAHWLTSPQAQTQRKRQRNDQDPKAAKPKLRNVAGLVPLGDHLERRAAEVTLHGDSILMICKRVTVNPASHTEGCTEVDRVLGCSREHGEWRMDFGVWSMEYGVWSMEYGVWSIEYRVWSMEYGVWSMEYGVWSMEYGVWSMEHGAHHRASNIVHSGASWDPM